jgi:hypothetical protein
MKKLILSICMLSILFTSCKKDPVGNQNNSNSNNNTSTTGILKIEFEHVFDTISFALNTKTFVTPNNDSVSFTKFKYYISNVKLLRADGTTYNENESYHLIDEETAASKTISINNVPFGSYTGISFMIGVDSTRNVSGSQTGALDPALGMFWTWNSGYIMAKLEGNSNHSGASTKTILYHVGGFSGINNVLKTISPSFNGSTANVSATVSPEIHIKCDVMEWFKNPSAINLATLHTIHMPGANAKLIANNYADMFSVEHIHN